ncbi:hypothetical protein [Arthrobacter sp. 2MCAF14]|uniref:hypothetical protein n=1 Tax=Arthrobacter sp. 2MCAF14 TaxID=3232982 RepID=UPI003F8DF6FD
MAEDDVSGHSLELKPRAGARRRELARRIEFGLVIALLAQFLLGMAVNLFVKVPESHPGAKPPEYFSGVVQSVGWAVTDGGLWLVLHAVLGLLLALGALAALLQSIGSHDRAAVTTTVVGLVCVLGAGFNGGSFLNYAEDFSSMIMASLFAVATGSYAFGVYLLGPRER